MINVARQNWKLLIGELIFAVCIVWLYLEYIKNSGYDLDEKLWFSYLYGIYNMSREYLLIAAWMMPYFICRMMPFFSLEYEFTGKKYFSMIRYKSRKEYYDRKLSEVIVDETTVCTLSYFILALSGSILACVWGYEGYIDYRNLITGFILWICSHIFMSVIEFVVFINIPKISCLLLIEMIQLALFLMVPCEVGKWIVPIYWGMSLYSGIYVIVVELFIGVGVYLAGRNFIKRRREI